MVTASNLGQYLDALAQQRLALCVRSEVAQFLEGLHLLVPDSYLSMFNENELEVRLSIIGLYSLILNGNCCS